MSNLKQFLNTIYTLAGPYSLSFSMRGRKPQKQYGINLFCPKCNAEKIFTKSYTNEFDGQRLDRILPCWKCQDCGHIIFSSWEVNSNV